VKKLLEEHERTQNLLSTLQKSLGAALMIAPNRKTTIISDKTQRSKTLMKLVQATIGEFFSIIPSKLVTAGNRQRKVKRDMVQGKRIVWADVGESKLDFVTLKRISDGMGSFLPESSSLFITSSSDDFSYLGPRLDGKITIIPFGGTGEISEELVGKIEEEHLPDFLAWILEGSVSK
jgi:hypothetical protein